MVAVGQNSAQVQEW